MNLDVPPLSQHTFVRLEKLIGSALDELVTRELIEAGKEELEYAVCNNLRCYDGVPAGQLETVEMETGNGNRKRKQSKLDANEC